MGVTLAIFSLSGKILCDKDRSKRCFSGMFNSPKQHRNILALMLSIPGPLLDLRDRKDYFSPFIKTVCSSNLVFMKSV